MKNYNYISLEKELEIANDSLENDLSEKAIDNFINDHPKNYVEDEDIRLEYISCGKGDKTIFLFPGFWGYELNFTLIWFLEKKYKVICPCHYPCFEKVLNIETLTGALKKILEKENIDKNIYLVAECFGGLVAESFYLKHSDIVEKVVLSNPFLQSDEKTAQMHLMGFKAIYTLPEEVIKKMFWEKFVSIFLEEWKVLAPRIKKRFLEYKKEELVRFFIFQANLDKYICSYDYSLLNNNTNTLIIGTDDDEILRNRDYSILENIFPNPQVNIFENGKHTIMANRFGAFIKLLNNFLDS